MYFYSSSFLSIIQPFWHHNCVHVCTCITFRMIFEEIARKETIFLCFKVIRICIGVLNDKAIALLTCYQEKFSEL